MTKVLVVNGLRVVAIRIFPPAPQLTNPDMLHTRGASKCWQVWVSFLQELFDKGHMHVLITLENGKEFILEH